MSARRLLLVSCAALLAAAPAARAGTVARTSFAGFTTVTYTAAPGEVNAVEIAPADGAVTLTDTGATVVDGDGAGGCSVSGSTATCPAGTGLGVLEALNVSLGDLDDTLVQGVTLALGTSELLGGAGDDAITGSAGEDVIRGEAGADTLDGAGGADDVGGGSGDDTVRGGAGDDLVSGGEDDDAVDGGDGDDAVEGNGGDDGLTGGAGADDLAGGAGTDALDGGAGNDVLGGGGGADALAGGDGDDYVDAGVDPGADAIAGGPGIDEVDYSGAGAPVTVTADGVAGDGPAGEDDTVATDVESLVGGFFDDTLGGGPGPSFLFGGAGDDALTGGDGDDSVFAGGGDDTIDGGPGRDRLNGEGGADTVVGGEGDDVLSGSSGGTDGEPDVLDGSSGSDTADYGASGLPLSVTLNGLADDGPVAEGDNVLTENVVTGVGDDTVIGAAGRNIVATGAGNDVIDVSGDGPEPDDVDCGSGFDEATVDGADAVATTGEQSRCETVNGLPATDSPAAIQRPVEVRDRRAPRITVSLARCPTRLRSFRRGCRLQVVGDEVIRVHARMTVAFKRVRASAGDGLVLAERDTSFSAADGLRRFTLRPKGRLLRRVPRRFRVRLLVEAFDRGGNRTATSRTLTVRR